MKFADASYGADTYTSSNENAQPSVIDHAKVKRLGALVARKLDTAEPDAAGAYRAVSLPGGGDLRTIASAFGKTAVGYRLAPVLKGKKNPFSTIDGVSVGAIPNTVFLNIESGRPHLSLLGHELALGYRRHGYGQGYALSLGQLFNIRPNFQS